MYQYFSQLAALGSVRYRHIERLRKRRPAMARKAVEEEMMEETDEEAVM